MKTAVGARHAGKLHELDMRELPAVHNRDTGCEAQCIQEDQQLQAAHTLKLPASAEIRASQT